MKKLLLTLFVLVLLSYSSYSQTDVDTLVPQKDTIIPKPPPKKRIRTINLQDSFLRNKPGDTLNARAALINDTIYPVLPNLNLTLSNHPYFNFGGKAARHVEIRRDNPGNDLMFYLLVGFIFYFALIKTFFSKYVNNLLAIFLRITLKQQQIREQLLQSPLPSLLLNILFVMTGGLYISLLLDYYGNTVEPNFWLQATYCGLLLVAVYSGKLIIIKALGWIFNIRKAADTYVFIVFLVNKMLGIFLLPLIVFIVFEPPQAKQVFVTLSLIFVVLLFIYRFAFSFRPIQNEIRWSLFQFFIYLCAFELAPLILIYKVLIAIVEKSH